MRLHGERAARGDDFRPWVPWVQSSWGDPRSLEPSRYVARSPRTSAPVAKKQIGQPAFWTAAGRQARDDTLSPATGCLLLHDSSLAPTKRLPTNRDGLGRRRGR